MLQMLWYKEEDDPDGEQMSCSQVNSSDLNLVSSLDDRYDNWSVDAGVNSRESGVK